MAEDVQPGCIEEVGFWGKKWGEYWAVGKSDCYESVHVMFPHGHAWTDDECTWEGRVKNAIALSFCLTEQDINRAHGFEIYPWLSVWFLEQYEKYYKLPGPCYQPKTVPERQAEIAAKLKAGQYPSFENLEAMALEMGCDSIEFIHIGKGYYEGDDLGDYMMGPSWSTTWLIKYKSGLWDKKLECKLKQMKPAHIELLFEKV